jgi:hypothetical protein
MVFISSPTLSPKQSREKNPPPLRLFLRKRKLSSGRLRVSSSYLPQPHELTLYGAWPPHVRPQYSPMRESSLANPIAPPARWWKQVAATMGRAASNLRDGEITCFVTVAKYMSPELAYIVWVERNMGKVGGSEDIALFPLRITMILHPEDGN